MGPPLLVVAEVVVVVLCYEINLSILQPLAIDWSIPTADNVQSLVSKCRGFFSRFERNFPVDENSSKDNSEKNLLKYKVAHRPILKRVYYGKMLDF